MDKSDENLIYKIPIEKMQDIVISLVTRIKREQIKSKQMSDIFAPNRLDKMLTSE